MKKIKLTQDKYALVDDEDFNYLNQFKWHMCNGYVVRIEKQKEYYPRSRSERKHKSMHRIINNTPEGLETDHINRNKLDNRKENLRTVTRTQNLLNRGLPKHNTSGHIGISWSKGRNKWIAGLMVERKTISLGGYENIKFAILARKWGERLYFKY